MKSLVISPKSLSVDIFNTFSWGRTIGTDYYVKPAIDDHNFIWEVHFGRSLEFSWSFSRDNIALRADPRDMMMYFIEEWNGRFLCAFERRNDTHPVKPID